eukprot:Protomagalhaensia_sp_Gyna_25__4652@NODE_435_length_3444_cov_1045_164464_g336_i0_p4_GENE_NODE_435_length_3444_cov_1045_164464_g336_i0NODE_435_length_3444_cov_1045_164464_g336_i0_p4_ORF_typecomplete_len126_score29_51Histone/PF00125_24/1_1e20CBFD_NFYB_HMF/PF00808_23/9_3e03CBFD_NFYB_HMF/PF00808_23/0_0082TFIID_20kDa/PF03847_13/0_017TFIID18kDa/PF02269_16/0_21DUF5062/PF16691_5/0_66DUF5062/PF16691_5/1e03_NODE_435_length_3444_cov_1045_164464_g336_i021502527
MVAEKKVAKKSAKKTTAGGATAGTKKAKRHGSSQKYVTYIYKVLKQVHSEVGISSKAMAIMNSFVMDNFQRICEEASSLCKRTKSKTLGAREIQTAVRLILPGELAKHAINEGSKAVTKFSSSRQ